jgi:hypothetical protein
MKNATRNLSILTFAIAKWIVQTTETVVLAQQADRRPQIMAHRSQCEKCGLAESSTLGAQVYPSAALMTEVGNGS